MADKTAYSYDGLQRISTTTYSDINDAGTVTASNRYNTSYTYADLRGNISNLQRNGLYLNGACYTQDIMDNLTYSYTSGTNKIFSIADAAMSTQGGFRALSGGYTYDANGNMLTNGAKGITSISYNHLNLPTNITITGGKTIDFTYAADGTKLRKVVKTGATINLVMEYVNGIEYRGTAIPATTLEAVYFAEGRLYNNSGFWKREYVIKDHLGNTRIAYCDINGDGVIAVPGEILQENNYDAFGYGSDGVYMNHANADNLYQYNGKELNGDHGLNMYDYGARLYDPVMGRFTTVDPLAADAPGWTPYNAMWNNPIKFVDPDGLWAVNHIDVTKNDDGTYNVVGGQANSDKNIYVVDGKGKRTGEVVGQMLTEYSFHHEDGSAVVGTNINLNDQSGQNFFNNEIKNVGLFNYIGNAKGGEPLDFKHRGINDRNEGTTVSQHHYRGMSFDGKVASARDIGNYAAGYVAGVHGFGWGSSRFAFDALQTKQEKGTWNTILYYPFNRVREGQPTQQAQRAGHNVGYRIFQQRKFEREWKKATNPWPTGPKY